MHAWIHIHTRTHTLVNTLHRSPWTRVINWLTLNLIMMQLCSYQKKKRKTVSVLNIRIYICTHAYIKMYMHTYTTVGLTRDVRNHDAVVLLQKQNKKEVSFWNICIHIHACLQTHTYTHTHIGEITASQPLKAGYYYLNFETVHDAVVHLQKQSTAKTYSEGTQYTHTYACMLTYAYTHIHTQQSGWPQMCGIMMR